MGFFDSIISATIKTVLTPVAIVADAGNLLIKGEVTEVTKDHVGSIVEDVEEAFDLD